MNAAFTAVSFAASLARWLWPAAAAAALVAAGWGLGRFHGMREMAEAAAQLYQQQLAEHRAASTARENALQETHRKAQQKAQAASRAARAEIAQLAASHAHTSQQLYALLEQNPTDGAHCRVDARVVRSLARARADAIAAAAHASADRTQGVAGRPDAAVPSAAALE